MLNLFQNIDFLVRDNQIDDVLRSVLETGSYVEVHLEDRPLVPYRLACCVSNEGPFLVMFCPESAYCLSVDGEGKRHKGQFSASHAGVVKFKWLSHVELIFNKNSLVWHYVRDLNHLAQTPTDDALPTFDPPDDRGSDTS